MSEATDEVYAVNRSVIAECERLRKNVQTISDKNHGPLEKSEIKSTLFPFVLLLGNHSSGKSSFVNYLMERKVQTAGVAPTDDNFTIIAPGEIDDIDRDGASLVGDPDLGFQGLKHFGPVLVHRTQLKIRTGTRVKGFCLVDTPGMIDSPVVKDHFGSGRNSVMDRGYDFEAVCRWYAERADVILLFFDPDKPGTTGETLSILTNSLNGLDHKLHIILNKADQFLKIHDFARAYGSLCWNLSKVIPRKDLPQIHTMCLPIGQAGSYTANGVNSVIGSPILKKNSNGTSADTSSFLLATESHFLRQGYSDLEESRMEVTREVFNAPKRRVDHEISRLSDSVYLLLMHCRVVDSTVSRYQARVWAHRITLFATGCAVAVATVAVYALMMTGKKQLLPTLRTEHEIEYSPSTHDDVQPEVPKRSILSSFNPFGSKDKAPAPPVTANHDSAAAAAAAAAASATAAALTEKMLLANAKIISENESLFVREYSVVKSVFTILSTGITGLTGLHWWQSRNLNSFVSSLISSEGYTETFNKLYARPIAEKDEFTKSLWQRVSLKLLRSMTYVELSSMRRVIPADLNTLERILEEDIANLRRQASPNFPSSSASSRALRPAQPHRVAFGSPSLSSSRKGSSSNVLNAPPTSSTTTVGVVDGSIPLLTATADTTHITPIAPITSVAPITPISTSQNDRSSSEGHGLYSSSESISHIIDATHSSPKGSHSSSSAHSSSSTHLVHSSSGSSSYNSLNATFGPSGLNYPNGTIGLNGSNEIIGSDGYNSANGSNSATGSNGRNEYNLTNGSNSNNGNNGDHGNNCHDVGKSPFRPANTVNTVNTDDKKSDKSDESDRNVKDQRYDNNQPLEKNYPKNDDFAFLLAAESEERLMHPLSVSLQADTPKNTPDNVPKNFPKNIPTNDTKNFPKNDLKHVLSEEARAPFLSPPIEGSGEGSGPKGSFSPLGEYPSSSSAVITDSEMEDEQADV